MEAPIYISHHRQGLFSISDRKVHIVKTWLGDVFHSSSYKVPYQYQSRVRSVRLESFEKTFQMTPGNCNNRVSWVEERNFNLWRKHFGSITDHFLPCENFCSIIIIIVMTIALSMKHSVITDRKFIR